MKRWLLLSTMILCTGLPQARAADDGYPALTLWPLAYHRADADSSTTDLLWPLIHHERRQTRTQFKLRPLLFAAEADAARDFRRVDLLWPLARFEREGAERWNHLFPLFWSGANAGRRWFHLWPLYGEAETADGTRSHATLYPLFGYSSNARSGDRSFDYLWPLGHAYRSGAISGSRLLPFWWQRRTPDTSAGFVFPYFWRLAPQETGRGLFPLWYRSTTAESRFSLLLPFYLERKTAASELLATFPGFLRYRGASMTASGLLPFWYRQRGPDARFTLLLPFYFARSAADSRLRVVFPGYFSVRSAAGTTSGLVPLWLQRERGAARLSLLLPLYLRQSDPEGATTLLLPFWLSSHGSNWHWRTLAPVYWELRTPEGELRLIPPLHLHTSDPRSETELWPLYFRQRDREADSELRYYFPFYGRYTLRGAVSRHYLLFPLYAHFVDRERNWQSWNVLWPLLHLETAPASYEAWALPFFWLSRAPQDARTMALGLYWSRQRADAGWSLLAPLWWSSHGPSGRTRLLLPLYAERERADGRHKRFFLGPLAMVSRDPARQERQLDLFWPLFSRAEAPQHRHTRLLPFYWHRRTPEGELTLASPALLPPYYLHRRTAREERLHLWPFFGRRVSEDERETSVLWPLIAAGSAPQFEHRRVLPFYWHTATPARTLTVAGAALLPPTYLHYARGTFAMWQFWPLYGRLRASDYRESSSLWPLLRWGENASGSWHTRQFFLLYDYARDERRVAGFFPLVHHWSNGRARQTASLLHWQGRDEDGYHLSLLHLGHPSLSLFQSKRAGSHWHHHLFPVYSVNGDRAADSLRVSLLGPIYLYARTGAQSRSHHFLWKVAYAERAPGRSEAGVLWRLLRSRSDEGHQLFEVGPFYYRERRADEEFVSWLGGVYARRSRGGEEQSRLFWFIRWRRPVPAAGVAAAGLRQ